MDSTTLSALLNGPLTDDEQLIASLSLSDVEGGILECQASLFARIITEKDVVLNVKGFLTTMAKAWGCRDLKVTRLGHNLLQIFFPSQKEVEKILINGPWCYDNNLIVLRPWARGFAPSVSDFKSCDFWIQIHNFPPEFLTPAVALKVGSLFSGCDSIELREDLGQQKFFRLKVSIPLLSPLRRVIRLQLEDEIIGGSIAYERLPNTCFFCGVIGHLIRSCPMSLPLEDKRRHLKYGMWIKANSSGFKSIFKVSPHQDGVTYTKDAGYTPGRPGDSVDPMASFSPPMKQVASPSDSIPSFDVLVGSNHPPPPISITDQLGLQGKRLSFSSLDLDAPAMKESLRICQFHQISKDQVSEGVVDMGSATSAKVNKGKQVYPMVPSPPSASLPHSGKPPIGKKRKVFVDSGSTLDPLLSVDGLHEVRLDSVSAQAVVQPRRSP